MPEHYRDRDHFGPFVVPRGPLLLHRRQPGQLPRLPLLGDGARVVRQGAGAAGLLVGRRAPAAPRPGRRGAVVASGDRPVRADRRAHPLEADVPAGALTPPGATGTRSSGGVDLVRPGPDRRRRRDEGVERQRGEGNLGCILWAVVVVVVAHVAWTMVPVKIASAQLSDFMEDQAQFAEHRSPEQIKKAILRRRGSSSSRSTRSTSRSSAGRPHLHGGRVHGAGKFSAATSTSGTSTTTSTADLHRLTAGERARHG